MQEDYQAWLKKSQAMIMVEYSGLNMKGINAIRAKAREAGGEPVSYTHLTLPTN
jgi:ribosomal protein L10